MANYGIMISKQLSNVLGGLYTEVHVMDFRMERIWRVRFEKLDEEPIPDTLREYIRENSDKIKAGRWHYGGINKK
ncbi:MAG: hypothetical protein ACQEWV_18650 [Bacillota bacterium]